MKHTKEFVEKESLYRQMNNLTKCHEGIYNGAVNDCMNLLDEAPATTEEEIRCQAIDAFVKKIKDEMMDYDLYFIVHANSVMRPEDAFQSIRDMIDSMAKEFKEGSTEKLAQKPNSRPAETLYNRIIERFTELQVSKSLEAALQRNNGILQDISRIQYRTYANAVLMTHEVATECNVVTCDVSEFYKELIERMTAWASKEAPTNDYYDKTRETICDTIYNAMSEIDEIAKELNIPEYEEQEERE